MKLIASRTSPFAWKVMVAARELGLADRIEIDTQTTSPLNGNPVVVDANPLGRVPSLIDDDGEALHDSRVICERLDALADGPGLFPPPGPARWWALRLQSISDGLCEMAIQVMRENGRPHALQWDDWRQAHHTKLERTYDVLNTHGASWLSGDVTIGQVGLATALCWIEFRNIGLDFRDGRPALADWHAAFLERPSMQGLVPEEE